MLSTSLLLTEQAIFNIRSGLGVIIDKKYLIFASELVDVLPSYQATIAVTKHRANFLFPDSKITDDIEIDFDAELLEKICFTESAIQKRSSIRQARHIVRYAILLTKFAELLPSAVIIDLDLFEAEGHYLQIQTSDIDYYSNNFASLFYEAARAKLVLQNANSALMITFRSKYGIKEHHAIIIGDPFHNENVTVRIHSSCYTGDVLGSLTCDCGEQLQMAIKYMATNDGGIILYLNQDGRAIGLVNKLRAYNLQQHGFDTVEANEILGFNRDERNFSVAAIMLKKLQVRSVKILSNNPQKLQVLTEYGLNIIERIPLIVKTNIYNENYLKTKISKLNHDPETISSI